MEEEVFQLTKAKPIEDDEEDNNNHEWQQNRESDDDDLMLIPKKKVKPQPAEEREFNELSNHFGNVVEVTPTETQEEQPEHNESQEIKPKLQKPKKALSGYFLFLKDYKRREDKGGANTSVSIHKDLATIWSTMSMDEKQKYNLLAQEEQKRYNQEMEVYKASLGDDYEGGSDGEEGHTTLLTLGKVKRIIKADPEIRKVSKASCEYIMKLTEAFGSFLLQEVEKNMQAENKKKPGMNDLVHVSRKVPGLMFLEDAKIFPDYEAQKVEREKRIKTEKESKKKAEKESKDKEKEKEGAEMPEPTRKTAEKEKKKTVVSVPNNKKISDFFGKSNN